MVGAQHVVIKRKYKRRARKSISNRVIPRFLIPAINLRQEVRERHDFITSMGVVEAVVLDASGDKK